MKGARLDRTAVSALAPLALLLLFLLPGPARAETTPLPGSPAFRREPIPEGPDRKTPPLPKAGDDHANLGGVIAEGRHLAGIINWLEHAVTSLTEHHPSGCSYSRFDQEAQPVMAEVSAGEIIDKITILQIKIERIRDPTRLAKAKRELEKLNREKEGLIPASAQLDELTRELKEVNNSLLDIENAEREAERQQRSDEHLIQLARQVSLFNYRRAAIKRRINDLLRSWTVRENSRPD